MARRIKITPMHQAVLDILITAGRPMGAYDILTVVSDQTGLQIAPPTIYRALTALISAGKAIRVESLNAFMVSEGPGAVLCVCRHCGGVVSLVDPSVERRLLRDAKSLGFTIDRPNVELTGTCRDCHPIS